jgi:hypothetical protein
MSRCLRFVSSLFLSALFLNFACGSDSGDSEPQPKPGSADAASTVEPDAEPSGTAKVGDACSKTSDCDASLQLQCITDELQPVGLNFNGGYCTKECFDNPGECGEGAVCAEIGSSGNGGSATAKVCVRTCEELSDCRPNEGYTCRNAIILKYCTP